MSPLVLPVPVRPASNESRLEEIRGQLIGLSQDHRLGTHGALDRGFPGVQLDYSDDTLTNRVGTIEDRERVITQTLNSLQDIVKALIDVTKNLDLSVASVSRAAALSTNRIQTALGTALIMESTLLTPATYTQSVVISDQFSTLLFLLDATTGNLEVLLPGVNQFLNRTYMFKRIDASGNTVTITPQASELIDGAASLALASTTAACLVSSNEQWRVLFS